MAKNEERTSDLINARYGFQETIKAEGWRQVQSQSPLEDRCKGLLKVITSHWMRSRPEEKHKVKCSWEDYILSWLAANGPGVLEQDVVEHLVERFGKPRRRMLGTGKTGWGDLG